MVKIPTNEQSRMPERAPPPSLPDPTLVGAVRRLLRPLVKLLIARGVGFPALSEIIKGVYVEVANQDFRIDTKPPTDSRINLITGIHRKDVKRLREDGGNTAPGKAPLTAQLIAIWTGADRYLDNHGAPRPLKRLAGTGEEPSFDELVTSVSKDIRPRAVLDEWLRASTVRLDKDDYVHLLTQAFVPSRDESDKLYYFGRNLHDHLAAGVHNLLGDGAPLLERNVYYDRLTPESVAALAALSREQGMQALQALNRAAFERQDQDSGDPAAQERMSFGVYFFATGNHIEPGPHE